MPKKVIAVDIDDVLAVNGQTFIEFSNNQWGTKLTIEDFQEDFRTMWGISNDEVAERMEEYARLGIVSDYPHIEDAVPVLAKLKLNYRLIVITSRRQSLINHTDAWLKKYFGELFEEVHYSGIFDNLDHGSYHATKAEICKDVGADFLIDDQLKHCEAVAEAGITALLFGEYTWNKVTNLPRRVLRVNSWAEVEKYFYGIAERGL